MTYLEIIKKNMKAMPVGWWCQYAFHYTDVTNIISILKSGKLYSRIIASDSKVMNNDNASKHVIDMTNYETLSNVRFYFRPLTPTQYYNEGYKHKQLRYDGDNNANIPIPIFLVFSLEKLLNTGNVSFSNFSQAGHGSTLGSGIENFANLEFEKIYSVGPGESDIIKYRHAELLYPDEYNIEDSLEYILCRNDMDKITLLNLLYKNCPKVYYIYKDKIRVCKENMFEYNGLFVKNILYDFKNISITFCDSYSKYKFDNKQMRDLKISKLEKVSLSLKFEWLNGNNIIYSKEVNFDLNYTNPGTITCKNMPEIEKAKSLAMTVCVENELIGYYLIDVIDKIIVM